MGCENLHTKLSVHVFFGNMDFFCAELAVKWMINNFIFLGLCEVNISAVGHVNI